MMAEHQTQPLVPQAQPATLLLGKVRQQVGLLGPLMLKFSLRPAALLLAYVY